LRKKLHNQARSARKGILTESEKKAIVEESIQARDIRELTSTKTKRSLTNRLNDIAKDLEILFRNKNFYLWYTDIYTHVTLNKIQGIIQQQLDFQELPEYKIAATYLNGKRMFTLKSVRPFEYLKSRLKQEKEKFFKKGLKEGERKIIWNFVEKKGFAFPLEKGKQYNWIEVKKLLQSTK